MGLSGEFWAAIGGAVVGGLITALIQIISVRAAANERKCVELAKQQGLARSLVFKVVKIESDFLKFKEHADECSSRALAHGLPVGWAAFVALANFPRQISFSAEEMVTLMQVKDDKLFNEVMTFDEVHAGVIDILNLYRAKRTALLDGLPAEMQGLIGAIGLDQKQHKSVAPKMAELDQLAIDTIGMIQGNADPAFGLSCRLVKAFNQTFNLKLGLAPKAEASLPDGAAIG